MPKINSVHYAGKWIGIGFLVGAILPGILWLFTKEYFWWLTIVGGLILLAFAFVFVIEMKQDFGKKPYYLKHLKETIPYDPAKQIAVIRSSICTGEQVAGFKNVEDGSFVEVMLIRNSSDQKIFQEIYGIETVRSEY